MRAKDMVFGEESYLKLLFEWKEYRLGPMRNQGEKSPWSFYLQNGIPNKV
jgi:hypothetical protein